MKTEYNFSQIEETWWCNTHQRLATWTHPATGEHHCPPNLGGIMLPCSVVDLTGIALVEPIKPMKLPELLITRHDGVFRVLNLFTEEVSTFPTLQECANFVFSLPEYTARWAV